MQESSTVVRPSGETTPLVPEIAIGGAVETLKAALPVLIRFLQSGDLREHPIWGNLIPFRIDGYGRGKRSLGHSVGADLVVDEHGHTWATEFDFAPSGRGYLLKCLPESEQAAVLHTFADWYRSMRLPEDPGRELAYYYATATTTVCRPETEYFCGRLRDECGIDIEAVNIDDLSRAGRPINRIVDRLFYASERAVAKEQMAPGRMMTKEPYLDSKMVFAMLSDSCLTPRLERVFGEELLGRLRSLIPPSYALDILRTSYPEVLAEVTDGTNRYDWIVKNTDVETDDSWGCRGVVLGLAYGASQFRRAVVENIAPDKKGIGSHPILQRYRKSADFRALWDSIVSGTVYQPPLEPFGKADYLPMTRQPATAPVHARIRPYFLIDASRVEKPKVFVPPAAIATLRQDPLSHGATDAVFTACRIV